MGKEMSMKKELVGTFLANRKLTYDLINTLSDQQLDILWSRPGLNSFRKHFMEMISVQDAFSNAIESKVMSFDLVPDVYSYNEKMEKNKIIEEMKRADQRLLELFEEASETKRILWFDMELSLFSHLSNLIQHEVFHQGMMTLALYENKISIPASWIENWALPESNLVQNEA